MGFVQKVLWMHLRPCTVLKGKHTKQNIFVLLLSSVIKRTITKLMYTKVVQTSY